jgi:hypothetical protein
VIITAATGCDNVAFGGIQVEVRPPPELPGGEPETAETEGVEAPLSPVDLGPLAYLVERREGSGAVILPIAELVGEEYRPLPDTTEVPRFLARFPLGRWDSGSEFVVFSQGVRVGTFVTDGTSGVDVSTCLTRPSGGGQIELRPEAASQRRFIALAKTSPSVADSLAAFRSGLGVDAALRAAALNLAQRVIPEMDVLWPASIPDIRRDLQAVVLARGGPPGLAVSYVFADSLVVGPSVPSAYGLFILAESEDDGYNPLFAWYQRYDDGKAFPRFVAAHDVRGAGAPDALLEVFGESEHWLALVGLRDEEWEILYEDGCGVEVDITGLRTFP